MSRVDIDYRTGSALNKGTSTLTTKRMLRLDSGFSTDYSDITTGASFGATTFTIANWSLEFIIKKTGGTGTMQLLGYNSTGVNYLSINNTSITAETSINNERPVNIALSSTTWNNSKFNHLILTCTNGIVQTYVNGTLVYTTTITGSSVWQYLGGITNNVLKFYLAKIYISNDSSFTTQEIQKRYESFLNFKPLGIATTNFIKTKPTSLNETGLVAAYNMIPQKGVLNDLVGTNNAGIVGVANSTRDGLTFQNNSYCTRANDGVTSGEFSIKFRMVRRGNGGANIGIFGGSTAGVANVYFNTVYTAITVRSIEIALNPVPPNNRPCSVELYAKSDGTVNVYIDGILSGTGNTNPLQSISTSRLFQYKTTLPTRVFEIQDFRYYNIDDSANVGKYHNSFISNTLLESFANNGADGLTTLPKGWTVQSGAFKIGEQPENCVGSINCGDKYLECATDGVISIPSKIAYGTWEFDMYKGSTTTALQIIFATSSPLVVSTPRWDNGYGFFIDTAEAIQFCRSTLTSRTDMFVTANSYIQFNTWYRMRVTRTITNIFTVYIKGGLFGNEWVLVTANTGTNPVTSNTYTTSNFFVLDIDAGDRISNIKILDGIIN